MKKILVIFLLFGLMCMASACTSIQNMFNKGQSSGSLTGEIKNNDPVKLILYYPDKTLSNLIPEERVSSYKNSPEETILSELLKGTKMGSPFAFPRGTKVLSTSRKDDILLVNFSKEFLNNFSGNDKVALLTIYSIVNSLTEIPGIKKIEIKVNGKFLETFGEDFKLNNPLVRNRALIPRDKELSPKEVLNRQLSLERSGKFFDAYLLYSDDENNADRKYYHDYVMEMEEVSSLGFTNQDFEIGDYTLDTTGSRAKVKVNFYTPTSYGTKEKGPDMYFNCVKVDGVWMVDWLTAQ